MQKNIRRIEMTGDRLLLPMLIFVYPILISNFCQRLFNAADSVIVGRFCGPEALAAVGGTGPVVGLFTWGLMGFSIGADVIVSRMIGLRDAGGVRRAVHAAYHLAVMTGLLMAAAGIGCARVILSGMGIPEEIREDSVLYLRIYFIGLFFSVVYNFGAACLRSGGDSQRPTRYMIGAGALNVGLNILFVSAFGLGVAGVAAATVLSQALAAVLVTAALMRTEGNLHLDLRAIRWDGSITRQIILVGLPACIQNAMFSLSNIVIQSSLNTFGSMTIAANSAASSVEEFVYVGAGAVNQTCTTFTGQNSGAGRRENLRRVLLISLCMTVFSGLTVGILDNVFSRQLLGLFTDDPRITAIGVYRLRYVVLPLFLNGIVDVFACSIRGMGNSVIPMVTSFAGICGVRLAYVFTIFRMHPTLPCLYLCYPLSWAVTAVVLIFLWLRFFRRLYPAESAAG